jgi:chromosome segregation ATPase
MSKQGKGKKNGVHGTNGPSSKAPINEEYLRAADTPEASEGEGMVIEFQHELLDHFLEKADELGRQHDQHTSDAVNRIEEYEKSQEDYKNLYEDNKANHEERRKLTEQILQHSKNFEGYTQDSANEKRNLRAEFDDLEDSLRKLKDQISEIEIENKNLQLIAETEQSIQDAKDRAEKDAIMAVNKDLKELVNRLAQDAEADISYQEVSERIKTDVGSNFTQSREDFERFLQQTDLARGDLAEDLRELKDRVGQRNQDNDELRGKIEEGEIEADRLNGAIDALNREIDHIKRDNEDALKKLDRDRQSNEETIADLRKTAEDLREEHSKLEIGIMKINSQLQYLDEASKSGGNDLIRKKIDKFDRSIQNTERSTEHLKQQLNGMHKEWLTRIETATRDMAKLIRESESKANSDKINQLLQELQSKQNEIEELKRKRNQLERDLAASDPEGTEREIHGLHQELEIVNEQLIALLRENNKNEIARLRLEIENARREQEEKGAFFADLLNQIEERRRMLEELQAEVTNNEEILQQLEETLQLRREEGDELDQLLAERDEEIRRLEARLEELNKNRPVPVAEPEPVEEVKIEEEEPISGDYVADFSDEVDMLLAQYINMNTCPVPIKRLGGGYYLFGTRKIYAKVLNGRLVIRVGGGYMVIDEFIATYAEVELKKMEARRAKGLDEVPSVGEMSPSNRSFGSPRYASPKSTSPKNKTVKAQKLASPNRTNGGGENGASFTTAGQSRLNGTMRTKQFTQDKLDKLKASGAVKDFRSPKAGK